MIRLLSASLLSTLLSGDVAEHVRVDIQTYVRDVVEVLARNEPNYLADLALGIVAGQASERVWVDLSVSRQLCDVVQRRAFGVVEEWARPVLLQGAKLRLVH